MEKQAFQNLVASGGMTQAAADKALELSHDQLLANFVVVSIGILVSSKS